MKLNLNRPLLIGGLGLTASLWLLDSLQHMDGSLAVGAVILGSSLWWLKNQFRPVPNLDLPQQVHTDRVAVEQALARVDTDIQALETQLSSSLLKQIEQPLAQLRQRRGQILQSLDRDTLDVAVLGNRGVGKSTLLTWLKDKGPYVLSESCPLEPCEDDATPSPDADLVLFITAGDLTASEQQALQALTAAGYPVLLVFNKQDQYVPTDRALVLEKITNRAKAFGVDTIAVAAAPSLVKVRRHLATGEVEETLEHPTADTAALLAQLEAMNPEALRCATGLRQAKQLRRQVLDLLNAQRRQQAMPLIEQMQWIAAGAAFANPLATLDLLAAAAVNGQLVMDLGKLYDQPLSIAQAKAGAGAIAKLTVQLGLVELSTQLLGTVLKSHAATYLAGGALQGASAAYLTRVAGLTLVDFFTEQTLLEPEARSLQFEGLGDRLMARFQQVKQNLALKAFATQVLSHLPAAKSPVEAA